MVRLVLPWVPISSNHLWRRQPNGRGMYLHPKAAAWKDEVIVLVRQSGQQLPAGDLALTLWLWPPDRRRRDTDNFIKLAKDALFAGFGADDYRVVVDHVYRGRMGRPGHIEAYIGAVTPDELWEARGTAGEAALAARGEA